MPPSSLPGARWVEWLRLPSLRLGVLTGIYLCCVMVLAVVVANRVPALEPYAHLRNWASAGLFGAIALIPVIRFRADPVRLFAAAVTAWLLFALGYWVLGAFFPLLHIRLRVGPLQAFILGAGGYGFLAVSIWVWQLARALTGGDATAKHR